MVGTTSMTSMEPLEKLLSRALHSPFPTTFYATVNFLSTEKAWFHMAIRADHALFYARGAVDAF